MKLANILAATLMFLLHCGAQAQIATHYAGGGFGGDGGPASTAAMGGVNGAYLDNAGNCYISDVQFKIRKVDAAGIITTIAGTGTNANTGDGGPATAADISRPTGVAIDRQGNIYFGSGFTIRKISPAGIITTIAGDTSASGGSGISGDGGPATAASLDYPVGIVFDSINNLYFADANTNRIRKIDTSGIITTIAGAAGYGYGGDGGPATAAQFNTPTGLAIDRAGNLYISDGANYRIRCINTSGIINTIAGNGTSGYSGDGGAATAAMLSFLMGVATDDLGNVYTSDQGNYRIRKIDPSGIITTCAGTGLAGGGFFYGSAPATSVDLYITGPVAADRLGNYVFGNGSSYVLDRVTSGTSHYSDSMNILVENTCSGPSISISPAHYRSTLSIRNYYGDGATSTTTAFSAGIAHMSHTYAANGTYSIKSILLDGTIAVDSVTYSYNYTFCNNYQFQFYYDQNSNCVMDSLDAYITHPFRIAIDSNGVAIDTISTTGGFYYAAYGSTGDIYTFHLISAPAGFSTTCPASGIVTDTLNTATTGSIVHQWGFYCAASGFDVRLTPVYNRTGVHAQIGEIYAGNLTCLPTNSTVTLTHDTRFHCTGATPAPTSYGTGSVTWNLGALSGVNLPAGIVYHLEITGTYLTPGDTVRSSVIITPTTGDADTTNNYVDVLDTARAGFDPNEMAVSPAGCFPTGTNAIPLHYTIHFENTGNDSAHNIYVLDTLPVEVNMSTFNIEFTSHPMMTSLYKDATGRNVLKFNFPDINLKDSSHHGECTGAVIFSVNTFAGLAHGVTIKNRAGIYFDVNPVVMTNQTENTIGCPPAGIAHPTSATPSFYPNPADDLLTIESGTGNYETCAIYNSLGEHVLTTSIAPQNTTVSVKLLPPGVYFGKLTGKQDVSNFKFVKR